MYPVDGDNTEKSVLIPNGLDESKGCPYGFPLPDQPASYQLVGRVMAYQGYDA